MYLFFDTETTGLPKKWQAPISDLNNWPRIVQLAWILSDNKGKQVAGQNYIIKPEGFLIPEESFRVHGISTEQAIREGIDLEKALRDFSYDLSQSNLLIAHNINFDQKIIGAEFLRKNVETNLDDISKFCTMQSTTNYCQIKKPNGYGYKWPRLEELHLKLFNKNFDNAHDALADVKACARCFFELKDKNII
jgi:DNA polymerase III epsilon subunit-like protein